MASAIEHLRPAWMSGYGPADLGRDALAGTVLSVLLVPQAMAYATLAQLSPGTGLLTAMVAPLVYAMLGRVAAVSMGPVALASLLVAEAVGGGGVAPALTASIVAIETGTMLAVLGAIRMGRLVNFVSEPALLGFTAAAAILIAASQVSGLTGIEADRSGTLQGTLAELGAGSASDPATLALGAGALLGFLFGERAMAAAARPLGLDGVPQLAFVKSAQIVVILAATLGAALWLPGVARIPEPEGRLPYLAIPLAPPAVWLRLLLPSLTLAVVIFVIGIAVAKSMSSGRRERLDSNREALAIGAANMVVGLTGGYASGVSLSRSALVEDAGARSPLSSAIAALIVLPVAFFGGALLAQLPVAALSALVISAIAGLVKLSDIRAVFAHSRLEGAIVAVTFATTLALGVQWGLLCGAVGGIMAFLWSSSLPRVTREGADPEAGTGIYRSIDRDSVDGDTAPFLILRIDRPLYFGNVGHAEEQVLAHVAEHPSARCLILDMRAVTDVDATGLRMLKRLLDNIARADLDVVFASLQRPLAGTLAKQSKIYGCRHYDTVGAATAALASEYASPGRAAASGIAASEPGPCAGTTAIAGPTARGDAQEEV